MATLQILDHEIGSSPILSFTVNLPAASTLRDVIRARVQHEVEQYNMALTQEGEKPLPKLLVTPTTTESRLNSGACNISPRRSRRLVPKVGTAI